MNLGEINCGSDHDNLMDSIPAHPNQMMMEDADNKTAADRVIADCLNNSVIVRILLEHFPNRELLASVQFVNKLWNYEARSIMRKRGNIFARIKCSGSNHSSCQQDFQAFAADVQQMNVVPFSGFHFSIHHSRQVCSCHGPPIPVQTHHVSILEMLPLKKVSISLGNKSWYKYNCPTFLLAKKVLENFHEALEQLSLNIPHEPRELITKLVQHSTFPRLKILKLEEQQDTTQVAYTKYVMSLVRRSPNLQQLRVEGPLDLRVNVLKGSQAVLVYGSALEAPFNISQDLVPALRPEAIRLEYTGRRHFNFERFNRMLLHLATAPSTTKKLASITMDAFLAISLMSSGIRFQNVRNFDMLVDCNILKHVEPRYLKIVQDFDFTRICPNLNKVRISGGSLSRRFLPADLDTFMVQAKATLHEPLPQRSINIRELELHQSAITNHVVEFFSHMFPHIKQFEVDSAGPFRGEAIISYASIWKHWANLEKLQVVVNSSSRSPNFDSVFCGIFPEEVAELRKEDDEHLRKVMIVPVMPAITCLRDLRALTLVHLCPGLNGDNVYDDQLTLFPSKVTALIAFARCPHLHVTLKTSLPQQYEELIRYMEPSRLVVCPPHGIHAS